MGVVALTGLTLTQEYCVHERSGDKWKVGNDKRI